MRQIVGENASDVGGVLTTTASSSDTGDSFTHMDNNTASIDYNVGRGYRVGSCPSCGYCQHCGRGGHQFTHFPYIVLPISPTSSFKGGSATCDTSPTHPL